MAVDLRLGKVLVTFAADDLISTNKNETRRYQLRDCPFVFIALSQRRSDVRVEEKHMLWEARKEIIKY